MPQPLQIGDKNSALFDGLTGFWTRFWRDTQDLHAYYNASEIYIGQAYLDMLSGVLNHGIVDQPVFNKEYWRLFEIKENEISFKEGVSVAEDRYVYDMPGSIRTADFLQNSIFDPTVLYERGVDFDVLDIDGYARFKTDPFREYLDTDGALLPKPGIAWRSVDIQVGNQFRDVEREVDWRDDSETKPGDILRLLAQAVDIRRDDAGANPGLIFYALGAYRFYTAYDLSLDAGVGDVIQVYGSGTVYDGYYIIKEIPVPYFPGGYVELEETFYAPLITSPGTLNWKLIKMSYFDFFSKDFLVDYIEAQYLVGGIEAPYQLGLKEPIVYAVVRDVAEPDVIGLPVSPVLPTDLGYTHIIPGSLKVFALRDDGEGKVREGEDYTVNYLTGWLYPMTVPPGHWDPASINTCSFQYQRELVKSAGGAVVERAVGTVKQLGMWVPEVEVDRFNLYYHYGYLLNRFEASSETYKAFLRGIMHLYVHGPIFERMVSGMNVVAGYPLIRMDGEVLQSYFNGIDAQSPTDGQIVGAAKTFTTTAVTYTFTELDIGGYIIFPNALSAFNRGKFRILDLIDAQTVLLESPYVMVDEGPPLEWVLSRDYAKVVVTDKYTYKYPYFVPMRPDIEDPLSIGTLTFKAFEAITLAFTLTDYVESPLWWVNKTIPYTLFPTTNLFRRIASDGLIENIFDPDDLAMFDDPGLFFDADEDGVVSTLDHQYRHSVGFILFDKYLKYHMFYVEISPDLELPASFKSDFEDMVLVTKPAYTYPYVEPNEAFLDVGWLTDTFNISAFKFYWGELESILLAGNELTFDAETDLAFDDYFTYVEHMGVPLVFPTPPVFPLVLAPGERPIVVNIRATAGGLPVLEGIHYAVHYDPNDPMFGMVELNLAYPPWDPGGFVDLECAAIVNAAAILPLIPDTTVGYTPLIFDGGDPAYVREAMSAVSAKTEHVDRPLSLKIDVNWPGGVSYDYDSV